MPCILLHPLLDIVQCIYIEGRWTPHSQLSIDALHTATPTARCSTMHIYRRQMDTHSANRAQMHCILLHPLLDLVQCIYIEGRWTPQSITHIDALHTATPTARSSTMHIYIEGRLNPQTIKQKMPYILLHPTARYSTMHIYRRTD